MPINMPKPQGSGLGNILGTVGKVAGIATGNPLLVAGGIAAGNSPLGKAISMYSVGSKAVGDLTGGDGPKPLETGPPQDASAIDRAIQTKQQDPMALVHQGLELADDESLPLDYETRMSIIEPLLRAKHFGKGGGLA